MKRLSLVVVGLVVLMGQTFVQQETIDVAWDAIPPLATGDTIVYEVFTTAWPVVDPQNEASHRSLGTTSGTNMVVTFPSEGDFAIGLRTIRQPASGPITVSDINWSDTNGTATPDPFVRRFYLRPPAPSNLRVQ